MTLNNDILYNTIFSDNRTGIYEIVNKHINKEKIEGNSNIALDLVIFVGVIGYLNNFEYLYTTTELTEEQIKTMLNYSLIEECLYCKGYNLKELIEEIL